MFVNFEMIDDEPIDNVVTYLNYKFDKVVYFGTEQVIRKEEKRTRTFLDKVCGITDVEFIALPSGKMNVVRPIIKYEAQIASGRGDRVFVDITGGDSLMILALGDLAKELRIPMHMYDIESDSLTEFDMGADYTMSTSVTKRVIRLDVDKYVLMQGGIVNHGMQKSNKDVLNAKQKKAILDLWEIEREYRNKWNRFVSLITSKYAEKDGLKITIRFVHEKDYYVRYPEVKVVSQITRELFDRGLVETLFVAHNTISFRFRNDFICKCLMTGGDVLELHTYIENSNGSDDCETGVHLDWDGAIMNDANKDVLNEVDVVRMDRYVPTFISCKSGRMSKADVIGALYELQSVADRFGGRYCRKELVMVDEISPVSIERAKEMGIEIRRA